MSIKIKNDIFIKISKRERATTRLKMKKKKNLMYLCSNIGKDKAYTPSQLASL